MQHREHVPVLILGAGPFGIAMAAEARSLGIGHVVVGRPMSFWQQHMPAGMLLRSGCDWHLDPNGRDAIERFLEMRGQTSSDVEPLSLPLYLEYAQWFMDVHEILPRQAEVTRLDEIDGRFEATLNGSTVLRADRVLLALGFASFAHIPEELAALVPAERSSHTCNCPDPSQFCTQRVLIVGGRQSAFEFAALLAEAGAAEVHVCHRHDTPAFVESDWTWVGPLLERVASEPGWYRRLSSSERESLDARFWAEGRLKLEPWLWPRVNRKEIQIRPRTNVVGVSETGEALRVQLNRGETLEVDHVLYATGYKPDLQRVPLLRDGNLLDRIECCKGFPVLDDNLQTTLPGLFVTSLLAARDFGLFFAFTAAVRASARIVGRGLCRYRNIDNSNRRPSG